MASNIDTWEDEGGAPVEPAEQETVPMSGTPNQVEYALSIKRHVSEEFDRVESLLRTVAAKQEGEMRDQTDAVIAILEEKRASVLEQSDAGYYIRAWQEITDQVRKLLMEDPRYQQIKEQRSELRNQE